MSKSLGPFEPEEEYEKIQMSQEKNTQLIGNFDDHLFIPLDAVKLVLPLDTSKKDLESHLDSMMVKAKDGEIKVICKVCGKSSKGTNWGRAKFSMKQHIETHIEGLSYPCNQCGKVSR